MSGLQLVLATANPDKEVEMRMILEAVLPDVELVARPSSVPYVEEIGRTFLDNARLKSEALCRATGLAAVADDSGLEVDALGGAPGLYSARYAGPSATYQDNVDKLLLALGSRPDRRARFISVVTVSFPDGSEIAAEGIVEGTIADAPRGGGGFGYDPVFLPDGGGGRSYSELDPDEKHALSHRGRALRELAIELAAR
ncbi:MAG TPA: RdgB/HAM1 family non-canonical purine NTP pyrophosphatase [Acidimicrobiales bacterium]|nr:RdgB/HAM1 family non-canonical purine NTP pyrophosphatase [Acidimicrobiales bacterium]